MTRAVKGTGSRQQGGRAKQKRDVRTNDKLRALTRLAVGACWALNRSEQLTSETL